MNINVYNKEYSKGNAKIFKNGQTVSIVSYEFKYNDVKDLNRYVPVFDKDGTSYNLVVDFSRQYVIAITKAMPVINDNNEIFYPIALKGDSHSKKYYINSKYLMRVLDKNSDLIDFARDFNYNPPTSWKNFQIPKEKIYFKGEYGCYPNVFVENEISKLKAELKAEREKVESLKKSFLDISNELMACVHKLIDLAEEK